MIRRTILKSPAEYAKELENYKQLKSNVAVIFKTPEIERQALVQALKLEEQGKSSAKELIAEQESTKEQDLTKVDLGLFNEINQLLDAEDFNIFPDNELQRFPKTALDAIKLVLQDIKRIDAGKPASQKSRYIDDSINKINRLLDGKKLFREPNVPRPQPRPQLRPQPNVPRPRVIRPSLNTSKSASADSGAVSGPSVATAIPSVKKIKYNVPDEFLPIINSNAFKDAPKDFKKLNEDGLKNYVTDVERSLNYIRADENRNKIDKNTFKNIEGKLRFRRKALNDLLGVATIGEGLSKSKSKSKSKSNVKPKPKPKSNLGAQEQIYYILSKRAGNNNELMRKRLKK